VNATDRTPADLLRSALATDPARPLVTFYDDATGERVELSVATFANWVAKTANLLQNELSAEPGDRVALLLPAHWQTAVWLLACSSVGVVADVGGDPAAADHVVAGPGEFEAGLACSGERIALSLAPLGRRFPVPPDGYADYAVECRGRRAGPGRCARAGPDRAWLADSVCASVRHLGGAQRRAVLGARHRGVRGVVPPSGAAR
jgi:uncharacterized protein (TIGR03089 family)